ATAPPATSNDERLMKSRREVRTVLFCSFFSVVVLWFPPAFQYRAGARRLEEASRRAKRATSITSELPSINEARGDRRAPWPTSKPRTLRSGVRHKQRRSK